MFNKIENGIKILSENYLKHIINCRVGNEKKNDFSKLKLIFRKSDFISKLFEKFRANKNISE